MLVCMDVQNNAAIETVVREHVRWFWQQRRIWPRGCTILFDAQWRFTSVQGSTYGFMVSVRLYSYILEKLVQLKCTFQNIPVNFHRLYALSLTILNFVDYLAN